MKKEIMMDVSQLRRRRNKQLFHSNNFKLDCITKDKKDVEVNFMICRLRLIFNKILNTFFNMHKNTRIGFIGSVVFVFFVVLIVILNLESLKSQPNQPKACVSLEGEKTCYAKDPNPYRFYGSKTAYHVVAEKQNLFELKGCSPKVFYLLSRHATRYPDEEYIKYINVNLPVLKEKILNSYENQTANLCEEDINNLREWYPIMKLQDGNTITLTGELESEGLGERLKKKFSNILGMPYSPETFIIEYTSRERTKHTAENFARGLFGAQDYKKINFTSRTNDKVLQFHRDCKSIKKDCEDKDYNTIEIEKFKNGTLMKKVLHSVSKRIGFNVSYEEVKHMQIACVFGYALNISDAWCSVFSADDLKVLEFYDDIDDYYKDAYGNEINYKQACPVIKYIVDLFKSYEDEKKQKVVLHFSHAGAIKKVYASLGLFRDDKPLTADNFCDLNHRKWRTSLILPFNSNIVFVLYNCSGELKFITLHNEAPVLIDGCDNKLCSLDKFYAEYETTGETCDIKSICNTCKI